MKIYVLYEEYEGSPAKIKGVFTNTHSLFTAMDLLSSKALSETLEIDPAESGIDWVTMTPSERESLKQECRDMYKYETIDNFDTIINSKEE